MDGWKIGALYLKGPFWLDLVGSFPISLLIVAFGGQEGDDSVAASRLNRQLRLLRIAKLNRLLRLSKLRERLKYLEVLLHFNPSALRVSRLFALMLCCCNEVL